MKGITTTYDIEYTEFDGKEGEYKTIGWTAYQKVLDNKNNIMTVENSQVLGMTREKNHRGSEKIGRL